MCIHITVMHPRPCTRKPNLSANILRINKLFASTCGTRLAKVKPKALRMVFRRSPGSLEDGNEPHMRIPCRMLCPVIRVCLLSAMGAAFFAPAAQARTYLSGTYHCVSAEVDGKKKPCKAPSLEMSSDGSYSILSEHGTYEVVKGHWLLLAASKNHGKARLYGTKEIIFEFLSRGKKSKIVYRRKFERPPAWVSS